MIRIVFLGKVFALDRDSDRRKGLTRAERLYGHKSHYTAVKALILV
jgi:hypothetical protein